MSRLARALTLAPLLALGTLLTVAPEAQGPPAATALVNQSDDPLLKNFRWRSIGPANMGGRINDIAVVDSNPSVMYVGYATGGIWKTTNNGTTWSPIFDTYPVSSIGDLAVSPSNPDILYVGTGEPNNRQSSTWGDGVYKSTDGGKTFTNVGLRDTQTIARIVIDPVDPNTVYVAALGHLFGPNPERGVFKTMDGGKTWSNVKFIDDDTGFTDIVMDARDSRVLYAASYQRRRTVWGFNGGGPGSGIWKTTDAGKTWTRLEGNGLPQGPFGRTGLDVGRSKANVVYAQIQVEMSGGPGGGGGGGRGGGGGGRGGGGPQAEPAPDPKRSGVWRSDDAGKTWRLMSNNNNRPMYYSQIRVDPSNDQIVYTMGAPFFKSTDGGRTFQEVGGIAHVDHHALWINPRNGHHLVLGNDGGLDVSYDQGGTWEHVNTVAVGQFYAIAADMRRPYFVCGGLQDNGSFCGPSALRSNGPIINSDWYRIGGGDGMYVQIDPTDYTTVYVESQNGNMSRLDLRTGEGVNIRPRARQKPGQGGPGGGGGGGGAPPPPNIVPEPPAGEQYRFHWTTPILLSPHNPRVVYTGANRFFKSVDRGDTWTASADLTKAIDRNTLPIMGVPGNQPMHAKNDGTSNYGNIMTIAESPVQPGLIWVGTDDGNVQVSRDGGVTFINVAAKLPGAPAHGHVSSVEASHFDASTAYVSIDAHESDDLKPYLWVTRDLGATFTSVVGNLPAVGNVNVIREDPKNRQLLYAGTEFGIFISMNAGQEWKRFMTGLATVRVDDLLVHPRDNDLIVGTHGRSILIVDDITPLQQWPATSRRETSTGSDEPGSGGPSAAARGAAERAQAGAPQDVHLFAVRPAVQWKTDTFLNRTVGAAKHFRGENLAAGTYIHYYLPATVSGNVSITVADVSSKVVRTLRGTNEAGINRVRWNLRADPPPPPPGAPPGGGGQQQGPAVAPGTYVVKLSAGGKDLTQIVVVEEDRWLIR
jgi:photosystem II stability/assembly factor-like uncharacterized protein